MIGWKSVKSDGLPSDGNYLAFMPKLNVERCSDEYRVHKIDQLKLIDGKWGKMGSAPTGFKDPREPSYYTTFNPEPRQVTHYSKLNAP